MGPKYKFLYVLGSGIAALLTMGAVNAAGNAADNATNHATNNIVKYNIYNPLPVLAQQSLHSLTLADAAATITTKDTQKTRRHSANKTANKTESKGAARRASKKSASVDGYQQLDIETERLLKEVLNLSSDLAILEEEQNTPAKHQLLVLVTMKPSKLFTLDYIELKIDNHTVAAYNYTQSDVNAMNLGGGHRLYLALLPAGMHKLSATMAGRIPRDPDYNKAVDFSFVSGVGRTVVELIVGSERSNAFPILAVKEWN